VAVLMARVVDCPHRVDTASSLYSEPLQASITGTRRHDAPAP
jgi:hypothetical protein